MSYNDSYGGGGYGGGERGYDERQGGGYGGGYDDRQGGGYGGGYDDRQGGGYGGEERGYDDRQGGGYNEGPGYGIGRQDPSEYGGGGRGSDNYYNQAQSFNTETQGRNYGGAGPGNNLDFQGGVQDDDDDYSGAMSHAQQHSSGSGDDSLFSSVLGQLSGNKQRYQNEDVDEEQMVGAHQAMYGGGGEEGRQHGSETVGAGAAMQAMKMFTGGGGAGGQQGGGQNALVGMAMGQASQLFDQQSSQGKLVSSGIFLLLFDFLQMK